MITIERLPRWMSMFLVLQTCRHVDAVDLQCVQRLFAFGSILNSNPINRKLALFIDNDFDSKKPPKPWKAYIGS